MAGKNVKRIHFRNPFGKSGLQAPVSKQPTQAETIEQARGQIDEAKTKVRTLERQNLKLEKSIKAAQLDAEAKQGTIYYDAAAGRYAMLRRSLDKNKESIQSHLALVNKIEDFCQNLELIKNNADFANLLAKGTFSLDTTEIQKLSAEAAQNMEKFDEAIDTAKDLLGSTRLEVDADENSYEAELASILAGKAEAAEIKNAGATQAEELSGKRMDLN